MKKIIILFFVFVIVLNLQAQKKINLSELDIDQLNLYKEQAIKMRNTGIGLTFGGGAVFITSTLLLTNWIEKHPIFDGDDRNYTAPNIYAILMICGGVSGISGIPVWIIGGVRRSNTEIALKKFDIKPENSMAFGLGVTLRF